MQDTSRKLFLLRWVGELLESARNGKNLGVLFQEDYSRQYIKGWATQVFCK